MKNTISIVTASLLLGLTASSAVAQEAEPHKVYDREEGEFSIGTEIPTPQALMQAIDNAAATKLKGMLEYAERLECYECVPALQRKILESDDASVREFAAWWLRRRTFAIGGVMTFMVDTLERDADPVHRARAAEAIGEFLSPVGLPALQEAAMTDSAAIVRAAAVGGLGRLNHPDGNPVIATALQDDDAEVRRAAIDTVLEVNFFREHDALIARLADSDPEVRRRASKLVGEFGVDAAVPALSGLLRGDADRDVRQAAAWALGRIGGSEARAALTEAQNAEESSLVRDAIRVALAML